MTDLEKFVALYREVGIELTPKQNGDGETSLTIEVGRHDSHPKIEGYNGFCTQLVFDEDGKFLRQGVWE